MKLVADFEYFAPVIFYFELGRASHCIFDAYEPYRKMTFRNRCTVAAANGAVHLSIPLEGGRNQRVGMKEVRIKESEKWQARHWKTITSAYNKSPWFDHYRDALEKIYTTRYQFLMDWNLACFEWAADKMAIKTPVSVSGEPIQIPVGSNEFEDWRNRLAPASLNNISPNPKRYTQVFEDRHGFIPNLSVLDYLFCTGNKLE